MRRHLLFLMTVIMLALFIAGCKMNISEKGKLGEDNITTGDDKSKGDSPGTSENNDDLSNNDDQNGQDSKEIENNKNNENNKDKKNNEGQLIFEAKILEIGSSLLIEPEEGSDARRSSDKITCSLAQATITDAKGKEITGEELLVGDRIRVTYDGSIRESYPAQITASKIEVVEANILLTGYLALIDDIYQVDSGLNDNIEMIAFDTTGWKDISDEEKNYLFLKVMERYKTEVIEGTYEELGEQGLIDTENLYFKKGILIKITDMEYSGNHKKIRCAIEKWRSGKGAIGSNDVTATFDGEQWEVKRKGMWIS